MKKIKDISEDEMIAVFLKGEITSKRFGRRIIERLERDHMNKKIIDTPNIKNSEENKYRKSLLQKYRGFQSNEALFNNFPNNANWERAILSKEDLKKVKYINYSYWNELSGGSRLVTDAVNKIKQGVEVLGESNKHFLEAAEVLKKGDTFPEIIVVSAGNDSDIVVLEGHARVTAYMLVPESIEHGLEVIYGYSDEMTNWGLY